MSKEPAGLTDHQAAEWVVRLEDRERPATAREQGEFFTWLMRSAVNVKAFLAMADLSRVLDGMDCERRLDIEKLFLANRTVIAPLRAGIASLPRPAPRNFVARRARIGALAAAILITVVAAIAWRSSGNSGSYRTAIGEQRTIQLPDGSVLNLNARSRVAIHFSKDVRRLELLEGEALFTVERDPVRPFSVRTRNATIKAVGTQFNVYERRGETTVSVVEGAVQVTPDLAPASARLFKAGEQAKIEGGAVVERKQGHAHDALAWRDRRLVFEEATLGEVLAEFNRYNSLQLHAEEALATTRRLTGVFSADKPQSLIHYLEQDPSLAVERGDDEVRISVKKSAR